LCVVIVFKLRRWIKEGIPDHLVKKLEIQCKGKNEKYFDYIDRIKAAPITIGLGKNLRG